MILFSHKNLSILKLGFLSTSQTDEKQKSWLDFFPIFQSENTRKFLLNTMSIFSETLTQPK
jgi:hypothetical protein